MAHGHPGYHGYAWYRRAVTVPAGRASWDILGPTLVEDGYELYWNGRRLGGSGRLGPGPAVVGTRPLRFALPADAAGTRGVLAVRAYMLPSSAASADGGGMHSAPMLAPAAGQRCAPPRAMGANHRRLHRRCDRADCDARARRPGALVPASQQSQGFLILASIALALTAARRLNNAIVAWTDLIGPDDLFVAGEIDVDADGGRLDVGLESLVPRPWRSIDVSAIVIAVAEIAAP